MAMWWKEGLIDVACGAYHVPRMVANTKSFLHLSSREDIKYLFPSPLSRDVTGEDPPGRMEGAHTRSKYSQERSMLICYLLIADDRPESVSLFLSPPPLGVGMGAQGSTLQGIEQEDKDVGGEWRQRKGLG